MTLSDPIADMLTRVRNALSAGHDDVLIPASRLKGEIARILQEEGLIHGYDVFQEGPRQMMRVRLKYTEDREPILLGLQRVSKPGRRIYSRREDIPRVRGGLGFAILSTSHGVMTGEQAWQTGVGGEVICYIW